MSLQLPDSSTLKSLSVISRKNSHLTWRAISEKHLKVGKDELLICLLALSVYVYAVSVMDEHLDLKVFLI